MSDQSAAVEQLLAGAGEMMLAGRRRFDVAAGLRRLREGPAGYTGPGTDASPVVQARDELSVLVRWTVNRAGATGFVGRLASLLSDHGPQCHEVWLEVPDIDGAIHGMQVFACMLYQADHRESAQFWWQLAAGAGSGAAAYCLHLHHLGLGEPAEAGHWRTQLQQDGGPDDEFISGVRLFADYVDRNCTPGWEPHMRWEIQRLASRADVRDALVCRPESEIADRFERYCEQH